MKNSRLYYFSYIFLCLIFGQILTAAQTPAPETVSENQANKTPVSEADLIHLGDLIDIDVVGSLEYDWRGAPNAEGFINIGYNENPIYVLCRDENAIAVEVEKAYAKILREPKVNVKILDRSNRPVATLYGAVRTPQRFRLNRPVFLNELIINSGGFTEKVSGEIQILRPKNLNCLNETVAKENLNTVEKKVENQQSIAAEENSQYINIKISDLIAGKKEANPQILSGDVITVSEAESVYVTGGVVNPRQIPFRSQITVSRAVASAGGLSKDALAQKVTIFRRENKSTKIIEVDLDKVKTNPAEDVVLQTADIIEVAQKGRTTRKYSPIVKTGDATGKSTSELPLRIID